MYNGKAVSASCFISQTTWEVWVWVWVGVGVGVGVGELHMSPPLCWVWSEVRSCTKNATPHTELLPNLSWTSQYTLQRVAYLNFFCISYVLNGTSSHIRIWAYKCKFSICKRSSCSTARHVTNTSSAITGPQHSSPQANHSGSLHRIPTLMKLTYECFRHASHTYVVLFICK